MPVSDFGKGVYTYFTWIKHELMAEALKVVGEVFFFDADVVLFRNPWIETTYGRHENGSHIYQPYDLMWQRDRGRGPSCGGSVNSGQMYVRNSTRSQQYFYNMFEVKGIILQGGNGLDQDFVHNATTGTNMTYCALSGTLFTTHCLIVFGNIQFIDRNTPLNKMISYHTACVEGLQNKKNKLSHMLNGVAAKKASNVIGGFVRQRRERRGRRSRRLEDSVDSLFFTSNGDRTVSGGNGE
eukprot:gene26391-32965_t